MAKVGEEGPIKSFVGHTDEINSIKWDPQGRDQACVSPALCPAFLSYLMKGVKRFQDSLLTKLQISLQQRQDSGKTAAMQVQILGEI